MKYILAFIFISCAFTPARTNRELFDDFHIFFAKADFKSMDNLLSESFFCMNQARNSSSPKTEYIEYMQGWNQVFKTKWNVESVEEDGQFIKSIEYDTDAWNDYFYGEKKRYRFIYTFNKAGDKITSLRYDTLPGAQRIEFTSQARYSKFHKWIEENYPGKLKYCEDMNKQSAIEMKALLDKYLGTK